MIDDINTKRTELANQMAFAGAAALDFNATAAVLAAIPDTEPQQYVAAGTPENIAAILPATISPQRRLRHGERPTETLVFDEPAATSGDAPDLQQLKALALAAWPGKWKVGETYADMYDDGPGAPETVIRDESGEAGIAVCIDFGDNNPAMRDSNAAYIAAFSPAVVLDLIARIERLTTIPDQEPSTEQEWAKVDPAVAFHLIERHAEDWSDAGRMMEAWRDATARAASPATASGDELPPMPPTRKIGENNLGMIYGYTADQMHAYARAAVSAATKPTADLSSLTRYGPCYGNVGYMVERASDEYVKLADVQSLLATKPAAAPAVPKSANFNMLRAMVEAGDKCDVYMDWRQAAAIYEAALAAAPTTSTIGTEQAQADSSHVLPPTRGTGVSRNADGDYFSMEEVQRLAGIIQPGDGWGGEEWEHALVNEAAKELASRCRAQGGVTNNIDSGNSASTIGAAQTADQVLGDNA